MGRCGDEKHGGDSREGRHKDGEPEKLRLFPLVPLAKRHLQEALLLSAACLKTLLPGRSRGQDIYREEKAGGQSEFQGTVLVRAFTGPVELVPDVEGSKQGWRHPD